MSEAFIDLLLILSPIFLLIAYLVHIEDRRSENKWILFILNNKFNN